MMVLVVNCMCSEITGRGDNKDLVVSCCRVMLRDFLNSPRLSETSWNTGAAMPLSLHQPVDRCV